MGEGVEYPHRFSTVSVVVDVFCVWLLFRGGGAINFDDKTLAEKIWEIFYLYNIYQIYNGQHIMQLQT